MNFGMAAECKESVLLYSTIANRVDSDQAVPIGAA